MSIHRRNPSRDANEPEIIEALERLGFKVTRVNSRGVPDLICSRRKLWHLCEVKLPMGPKGGLKARTLTEDQQAFADHHTAHVRILRTVDDALTLSQEVP